MSDRRHHTQDFNELDRQTHEMLTPWFASRTSSPPPASILEGVQERVPETGRRGAWRISDWWLWRQADTQRLGFVLATATSVLVLALVGMTSAGVFMVADGPDIMGTVPAASAEPDETAEDTSETTETAAVGGTPDSPRQVNLLANAALQFTDEGGTIVNAIPVTPGETIEFVIDNTAGFEHNFYIGPAEDLQGPYAETDVGIPAWESGVQTIIWTVPEEGAEVLQFACTVPGHYTPMHGNFQIQG